MNAVIQSLYNRKSVRAFLDRAIPEQDVQLILQAAECRAPFACRFPVGARLQAGEALEGEITLSPREGEYGFLSGQLLLVTNDPEQPARRIRINATVED